MQAKLLVERIVNGNVARLRPRFLLADDEKLLTPKWEFTALIEAAYWWVGELASGSEGKLRLKRCRECRRVFVASHDPQLYCPPPPNRPRSLCGGRHQKNSSSYSTERSWTLRTSSC